MIEIESLELDKLYTIQSVIDNIEALDYKNNLMLEYNIDIDNNEKFVYTNDQTFDIFNNHIIKYDIFFESTNETGSNFFKRLLNHIKQLWDWICKQFKRFIQFISKYKPKKTVDQICEETVKHIAQEMYIQEASTNNRSKDVHFPASPDSVIKSCDLHLVVKDLTVKIKNNNYEFHQNFGKDFIYAHIPPDKDGGRVVSGAHIGVNLADPNFRQMTFSLFFYFIQHPAEIKKLLMDVFDDVTTNESGKSKLNDNVIISAYKMEKLIKKASKDKKSVGEVNASILTSFNKLLSEIQEKFHKIDSIDIDATPAQKEAWKTIIKFIEYLSYGCNNCATAIKQIYMCDLKYLGSIKDIDELSIFVKALIDNGIPAKYVAFNTWVVADHSLIGGGELGYDFGNYRRAPNNDRLGVTSDPSTNKRHVPYWGMTRVTFFPREGSNIIKIAMNGAGVIGNKRESEIFNRYKKYDADKFLAKVEKTTTNDAILIQEKMYVDSNYITDEHVKNFKNLLNELYSKNKNLPKISDIHDGNLGVSLKDKRLKILDYAGR